MNLRYVVEGMIKIAQGAGDLILDREDIHVKEKGDGKIEIPAVHLGRLQK